MSDAASTPPCDCVECKVRAACGFDKDVPVDIRPAIMALGNVLSELLAYRTTREAKMLADELLTTRRKWLNHPRVAAQQQPAGHA